METMIRADYNIYHITLDNIGIVNIVTIILTDVLYSIGFLCRIQISKSTL